MTNQNPLTGQNLVLRAAEAMDSVDNAIQSGMAGSSYEAAGHLLCSVVELRGVLYMFLILFFTLVGIAFLPPSTFLVSFTYDFFCCDREDNRHIRHDGVDYPANEGVSGGGGGSEEGERGHRRRGEEDQSSEGERREKR